MELICLDLEGVLVPEIWIAVSAETGIKDLELTTRDVPDYDELMRYRINLLEKHDIGLERIQSTIAGLSPLAGGYEFLRGIRERWQVIILSDTFEQFAKPLMTQLGWPTIFCNSLVIENGRIVDYKLRVTDGKRRSVEAFTHIGYRVVAIGDSYNDLGMIDTADHGILFKAPSRITEERPDLIAVDDYIALEREILAWDPSS